jgi:hypothetical protein
VAACARDFMTRLSALRPHNPRGVYSFFSFITAGNCAGLRSYPLWLAIFQPAAPSAPAPWSAWRFWQSGAASSHDNDVFNGTPAELAAWIGSFQPQVEVEVQSGQLNTGASAVTVITVPHGSGSSSTVDSTKGQTVLPFPVPKGTGVISVKRLDAGEVIVGYEVS